MNESCRERRIMDGWIETTFYHEQERGVGISVLFDYTTWLTGAWPLNDENNWIGSSSDYWDTIKKSFKDIMNDLKGWHNNNNNNERGLEIEI